MNRFAARVNQKLEREIEPYRMSCSRNNKKGAALRAYLTLTPNWRKRKGV